MYVMACTRFYVSAGMRATTLPLWQQAAFCLHTVARVVLSAATVPDRQFIFRFQHTDAPQPEELLQKIAESSVERMKAVDEKLLEAFEEQAKALLEQGGVRAMAGKTSCVRLFCVHAWILT